MFHIDATFENKITQVFLHVCIQRICLLITKLFVRAYMSSPSVHISIENSVWICFYQCGIKQNHTGFQSSMLQWVPSQNYFVTWKKIFKASPTTSACMKTKQCSIWVMSAGLRLRYTKWPKIDYTHINCMLPLSEKKNSSHDQRLQAIGLHQKWPACASKLTRFQNESKECSPLPAYVVSIPEATFIVLSIEVIFKPVEGPVLSTCLGTMGDWSSFRSGLKD